MCENMITDLGPVEYSIIGEGTPVLFFHGGHSNCRETLFQEGWDLNQYKIITPSRPGYGQTDLSENGSPKKTAQLFHALILKLGFSKVIVVGISAGGLSAIEYASQFPQGTCSLILISAVTQKWLNENDDLYKRGKKMFSPHREKMSWRLFRLFFNLFPKMMSQVLLKEISTVENAAISNDEVNKIREMTSIQSSGNGFVNDLDQNIDASTILDIKCPTLILHSENDQSVPISMAYHAKNNIVASSLRTYDNKWGHLLWVGQEKQYPIEDLNSFLLTHPCNENI